MSTKWNCNVGPDSPCRYCEHRQCQYFGRNDCPDWGPYRAKVDRTRKAELAYRIDAGEAATRKARYGREAFGIRNESDYRPKTPH